jgi:hypothetical protein
MEIRPSEVAVQLMRLAPHVDIAHHIPGRIRLKILPAGLELVKKTNLHTVLEDIPGISSIRLNRLGLSVVIEYDTTRFPFDLWERMLQVKRRPELFDEIQTRLQHLWD